MKKRSRGCSAAQSPDKPVSWFVDILLFGLLRLFCLENNVKIRFYRRFLLVSIATLPTKMAIAENRHHRQRKINEKKRLVKSWKLEGKDIEKNARILARTPKPCSKECCGNPRRFGGGNKHNDKKKMQTSIEGLGD